jgi:hypothetical protein
MWVRGLFVKMKSDDDFKSNFISVSTIALKPLMLFLMSTGVLWIYRFAKSKIDFIAHSHPRP